MIILQYLVVVCLCSQTIAATAKESIKYFNQKRDVNNHGEIPIFDFMRRQSKKVFDIASKIHHDFNQSDTPEASNNTLNWLTKNEKLEDNVGLNEVHLSEVVKRMPNFQQPLLENRGQVHEYNKVDAENQGANNSFVVIEKVNSPEYTNISDQNYQPINSPQQIANLTDNNKEIEGQALTSPIEKLLLNQNENGKSLDVNNKTAGDFHVKAENQQSDSKLHWNNAGLQRLGNILNSIMAKDGVNNKNVDAVPKVHDDRNKKLSKTLRDIFFNHNDNIDSQHLSNETVNTGKEISANEVANVEKKEASFNETTISQDSTNKNTNQNMQSFGTDIFQEYGNSTSKINNSFHEINLEKDLNEQSQPIKSSKQISTLMENLIEKSNHTEKIDHTHDDNNVFTNKNDRQLFNSTDDFHQNGNSSATVSMGKILNNILPAEKNQTTLDKEKKDNIPAQDVVKGSMLNDLKNDDSQKESKEDPDDYDYNEQVIEIKGNKKGNDSDVDTEIKIWPQQQTTDEKPSVTKKIVGSLKIRNEHNPAHDYHVQARPYVSKMTTMENVEQSGEENAAKNKAIAIKKILEEDGKETSKEIVKNHEDYPTTAISPIEVIEKEITSLNSTDFRSIIVCHDLVGCFKTGSPWRAPSRPCLIPEHPAVLGTEIWLHNKGKPHLIYKYPFQNITSATFQHHHDTYFIIHGLFSSGKASWVSNLVDAVTRKKHSNVLVVDWSPSAKALMAACGNIRVVAREVAAVARILQKKKIVRLGKTHCIGHGFGAHVCGLLGKNLTMDLRLGTIFALDAAQQPFEGSPPLVRLSKQDARIVVAHHTNALPFAAGYMDTNIANIHFYYNGGVRQPGCPLPTVPPALQNSLVNKLAAFLILGQTYTAQDLPKIKLDLPEAALCSHYRVTDYFLEGILNQCHLGYPLNPKNFLEGITNGLTNGVFVRDLGSSVNCSESDECLSIGLDTSKYPESGVFSVLTRNHASYCLDYLKMKSTDQVQEKKVMFYQRIVKIFERLLRYDE